MRRTLLVAMVVIACGKSNAPPASTPGASGATTPAAGAGESGCAATGRWATCSVLYRLERAGVAPRVDSTAKPSDENLGGVPLVVKIGLSAVLELHLYPDSAARVAAVGKLDRSQFVNATAEQTIRRERTLIESANLVGLLTSINGRQRERVSDALTAGPPQPIRQ